MSGQWYFIRDGKSVGPVSIDVLKAMVGAQTLQPTDMVIPAESKEWVPAGTIQGLFGTVAVAGPAPTEPKHSSSGPVPLPSHPNAVIAPRSAAAIIPGSGYVEKHLNPGERVVHCTRKHILYVLLPMLLSIPASLLIWLGQTSDEMRPVTMSGLCIFVSTFVVVVYRLVVYLTDEYAVTTSRLIWKEGWLNYETKELQLDKIEGVGVKQSLFGRLLNYGDLLFTGTGSSKEKFSFIQGPVVFRKHVQEEIGNRNPTSVSRPEKKCPWCAEMILVDARVCKHCRRDVI